MGKIADFIKGVALPEQKKRQALALEAEYEEMQSHTQVLESENLNLRAEVNPLKREIEGLKEKIAQLTSSATNALVFNQTTGTHIDPSTGIHYCTRCLPKRSPLTSESHGWRCGVCDKFFPDPSRPEPYQLLEPESFLDS